MLATFLLLPPTKRALLAIVTRPKSSSRNCNLTEKTRPRFSRERHSIWKNIPHVSQARASSSSFQNDHARDGFAKKLVQPCDGTILQLMVCLFALPWSALCPIPRSPRVPTLVILLPPPNPPPHKELEAHTQHRTRTSPSPSSPCRTRSDISNLILLICRRTSANGSLGSSRWCGRGRASG